MDLALKKAVEGGYITQWTGNAHHQELVRASILMDVLFWQALGRQMGWGDYAPYELSNDDERVNSWLWPWHRFIDHLAEGKKPDEFFEELLPIKK